MITRLSVHVTDCTDPYTNLAVEEHLLRTLPPGQCTLYLWQNRRTVVIGRNQNARNECRIQLLEAEGGRLARRLSGGGAVYHDLGNLNFTFLVPENDFDTALQTSVILSAVNALGVRAEKTGRNDLTADGKKFSGHAYYRSGSTAYHHGTLMVSVDPAPLARYLTPPTLKLRAKGVPSVRSRVCNLKDHNPAITVDALKAALIDAAENAYRLPASPLPAPDPTAVERLRCRYASPEWKYGRTATLDRSAEARFAWGTARIDFTVAQDVIADAALWSDGLDADYLDTVPHLLRGTPLTAAAIRTALTTAPDTAAMADDIAHLIIAPPTAPEPPERAEG